MKSGFRFLSAAADEAAESFSYYDDISGELGKEFIEELDAVIDLIRKFPESGVPSAENLRSFRFGRFPFRLVYKFDYNQVVIIAVAHQSRRPEYWKGRL